MDEVNQLLIERRCIARCVEAFGFSLQGKTKAMTILDVPPFGYPGEPKLKSGEPMNEFRQRRREWVKRCGEDREGHLLTAVEVLRGAGYEVRRRGLDWTVLLRGE